MWKLWPKVCNLQSKIRISKDYLHDPPRKPPLLTVSYWNLDTQGIEDCTVCSSANRLSPWAKLLHFFKAQLPVREMETAMHPGLNPEHCVRMRMRFEVSDSDTKFSVLLFSVRSGKYTMCNDASTCQRSWDAEITYRISSSATGQALALRAPTSGCLCNLVRSLGLSDPQALYLCDSCQLRQ